MGFGFTGGFAKYIYCTTGNTGGVLNYEIATVFPRTYDTRPILKEIVNCN